MPGRRPSATSSAFTLVEMLMVIGILMLLLALTAGSVLRTPKVDALVGTEQLLSDMIRQARHTARSTGSPVLLQINAANRTIMGVSQVPIWSETFEDDPTAADPASKPWYSPFGQTGQGIAPTMDPNHPNQVLSTLQPFDKGESVARNLALTRDPSATSGFYLACAVNLPDVNLINATMPADQAVVPLALVGTKTDATCTCGLAARWKQVPIQNQTDSGGTVVQTAQFAVWDIIGWVNDTSKGMVQVASVENSVFAPPMPLPLTPTSGLNDVAGPIVGGRWEDLGLLYDGTNLELMRNGQLIASLVAPNTPPAAPLLSGTLVDATGGTGPMQIFLSAAYLPTLTAEPNPPLSFLLGTLDNCRLFRLGTEHPTALPAGAEPVSDSTMRVRPDGIIEFRSGTSAATTLGGTMLFNIAHSVSSPGVADQVQITVNPDGSLATMVSAGAVSASAAGVQ